MGNYGRHVNVCQPPLAEHRAGQYIAGEDLVQWCPVVASGNPDANGQIEVNKETGATVPLIGVHGLVCYEQPDANFVGYDPLLTRASDMGDIPAGSSVQLVRGPETVLEFRNFPEVTSFHGMRDYPARIVIAGVSIATPTLAVGNLLTPGVGDDTDGYWAETANEDEGWLRVQSIDTDLGLVVAQVLF